MSTEWHELDVGPVKVKLKADDRIVKSVLSGKPFEPDTLDFFAKAVIPDTMVLDIGCYSGLFAIAAIKLGAAAMGYEPYPPNRDQIFHNQKLNAVRFGLSTFALSDHSGVAQFGFHKNVHLTSGGSLERKSGDFIDVPTKKLDDVYDFKRPISVIKMDVERHEPAVLRGGEQVIKKHKPVLIIEANDEEMKAKVLDTLKDWDYDLVSTFDVRNLVFQPRRTT